MAVSATLATNEEILRRQREGLSVVPLSFGQAGVPVHPRLRQALADAADRNGYGSVAGSADLRRAAAGYWQRRGLDTDPARVVVGPGSKALLYAVLQAVGGDVVIPQPTWVSYAAQVSLLGRRAVPVPTRPGQGGVPDPDLLVDAVGRARADGRDVRAVVVTLPDNPTGTLADPATVDRFGAAARELDLVVVSDEIYRDLVYSGPFRSPASVVPERTVVTGGLSKSHALGGWRLGVARFPSDVLRDRVLSAASEIWSCVAEPVQAAAALAYDEPDDLAGYVARARGLYHRLTTAVAGVFTDAGAVVATPQAAFYTYPSVPFRGTGTELARRLLDRHGVATIPAAAFGEPSDPPTLRISTGMLTGADDVMRMRALDADDPLALPWIADALDHLGAALKDLPR